LETLPGQARRCRTAAASCADRSIDIAAARAGTPDCGSVEAYTNRSTFSPLALWGLIRAGVRVSSGRRLRHCRAPRDGCAPHYPAELAIHAGAPRRDY